MVARMALELTKDYLTKRNKDYIYIIELRIDMERTKEEIAGKQKTQDTGF